MPEFWAYKCTCILKTRCTTPFLKLCKYNYSNKKIRSISVYEGLVLIVVYSNVILKSLCAYMTLIFCLIYAKQINVNWMLIKNFSLRWIKLAIHVNLYYNAPRYINQSFSEYMRYIFRCILVTHFLLRFFWHSLSKVTQTYKSTIMDLCIWTFYGKEHGCI